MQIDSRTCDSQLSVGHAASRGPSATAELLVVSIALHYIVLHFTLGVPKRRNRYWPRPSVCLSVCLSVLRRILTPLHGPGCNVGEW